MAKARAKTQKAKAPTGIQKLAASKLPIDLTFQKGNSVIGPYTFKYSGTKPGAMNFKLKTRTGDLGAGWYAVHTSVDLGLTASDGTVKETNVWGFKSSQGDHDREVRILVDPGTTVQISGFLNMYGAGVNRGFVTIDVESDWD